MRASTQRAGANSRRRSSDNLVVRKCSDTQEMGYEEPVLHYCDIVSHFHAAKTGGVSSLADGY